MNQPNLTEKNEHNPGVRTRMLLFNLIPLLHFSVFLSIWFIPFNWTMRVMLALGILYLIPPLLGRLILIIFPINSTHIASDSRDFVVWWALANLQTLFVRFSVFEELLRLVPGLYSAWLRLWGAKLGRLIYWAPGTVILDRSFLRIGNDVIFGAGVRLNAHVIAGDSQSQSELLLADISIGDNCIIGGYSLLTAGTVISANEKTRAFFIAPPFSRWEKGKRRRDKQEFNTNKSGCE